MRYTYVGSMSSSSLEASPSQRPTSMSWLSSLPMLNDSAGLNNRTLAGVVLCDGAPPLPNAIASGPLGGRRSKHDGAGGDGDVDGSPRRGVPGILSVLRLDGCCLKCLFWISASALGFLDVDRESR